MAREERASSTSSHSNFLSALRPSSPPSADHGLACGLRTVLGLLRGAPPSRAESSRPCRTPIAYNPRPSGRDTPPWTPRARGAPASHGPMGAGGCLGKLRDAVPRPRDKLSDTGERVC